MHTHSNAGGYVPGLRRVTPALRRAEKYAEDWRGLNDGRGKRDVLRLIADVSHRALGISKSAKQHLADLHSHQPPASYLLAGDPALENPSVVSRILISTFNDGYWQAKHQVSSETVRRWRSELVQAGWICFRDSPDRSRYRQGSTDAPDEAFGVDLRPLLARINELTRLKDADVAWQKEFRAILKTLSCRANRLRILAAAVKSASDVSAADVALKAIQAARRGYDLDVAKMALAQADEAVLRLETIVDAEAELFHSPSETMGAPHNSECQLLSTSPLNFELKIRDEGREALQEGGADSENDDGEEDVWESTQDYGEADDVQVIEIAMSSVPSAKYERRVNLPKVHDVVRVLPQLLLTRQYRFVRHPDFPTDAGQVIYYGKLAAVGCGLNEREMIYLSRGDQALPFAIAALISYFRGDVKNRRAYLVELANRVKNREVYVDLWASWQKICRENGVSSLH